MRSSTKGPLGAHAAANGNLRAYTAALNEHLRLIASVASLDFSQATIDEVAAQLPSDKVGWARKTIRVARVVYTELVPNLRRELDLRWFFGHLRPKT